MSKPRKKTPPSSVRRTMSEQERIDIKRALDASVKRERAIQSLSKQLDRAIQRSNDGLQGLVGALHARSHVPRHDSAASQADRE